MRRRHCVSGAHRSILVGGGGTRRSKKIGGGARRWRPKNLFKGSRKNFVPSSNFSDDLCSSLIENFNKISIGGAPPKYRRRRADQQMSAAAWRGATGARLYHTMHVLDASGWIENL